MYQRDTLLCTLERTEADTLSPFHSLADQSSRACFIRQKRSSDSTTTWVSPSLVKKLCSSL
ncbi:hypothetical protein LINPERPRIM_LOCUS29487 [Linum perenne]